MLSFVGAGPGDPQLLTFRAARVLMLADEIAVPDAGSGASAVLGIVREFVRGKPVHRLPMPMREGADWADAHERAARFLMDRLEAGLRVAYPVLGDASLYATSGYLYRRIAPHYPCEIIPGVPAMCAAAAALGAPLAEGRQRLTVLPGFRAGGSLPEGNVVILKAGRALDAIRVAAGGRRALLAQNVGMAGAVLGPLDAPTPPHSYYATVLIGPGKEEP